jgi:hypothetical protein
VAANVLRHGTGAMNIDATRIGYESGEVDFDRVQRQQHSEGAVTGAFGAAALVGKEIPTYKPGGRWPANLVLQHLDGCVQDGGCAHGCPVAALDEQSGVTKSTGGRIGNAQGVYANQGRTGWSTVHEAGDPGFGDTGGASRYFKQVKP